MPARFPKFFQNFSWPITWPEKNFKEKFKDQKTVPIRIGTMVGDFGPKFILSVFIRSVVQNFGPKLADPVRVQSKFFVSRNFARRSLMMIQD